MASDLIDLDVFVGEPLKVKLGGKTLLFPRDIPAALFLEIHALNNGAEDIDDETLIGKLHADVLELLQVHQPEMTKLPAAMSLPILLRTISALYGAKPEETAEDPPAPAAKPASGGKSRRPKSPSASSS